ncbi:STAS domain-containing protein [Kitasatospora sp. NPDC051914]|uniref:STAS domain-containing protein n=1 Tax=Kitasatospora sp. NPDC051914 TaxID=3154945 RepID=UPI00341CB67B
MTSYSRLVERAGPVPDIMIDTATVGQAVVCSIAGMLHTDNERQVRRALDVALGRRPAVLAVDLSGVRLFTSSGVNALLDARQAALAGGIPLVLIAPSASVRRTLAITDTTVFPIYPALRLALHHRGPTAP